MSKTYQDLINTLYPDDVENAFETKMDATADMQPHITAYKNYFNTGNMSAAKDVLKNNPKLKSMMITAADFNRLQETILALCRFATRTQQQIIFSATEPSDQTVGDIWMKTSETGVQMYELTNQGYVERMLYGSSLDEKIETFGATHMIQTFSDVTKLGLSVTKDAAGHITSFPTVAELYDKMPNYSIFVSVVNADNTNLSNFWNLPALHGFIELKKVQNKRGTLEFWDHANKQTYISSNNSNGVPDCVSWHKVLTTADFEFDEASGTLNINL